MSIPWLLQRYIFREMFKAFALAAVVLTGVLGLGGGVLNMMKLGEVTPGQLIRLMGLVLPLSAALTLPIAALFSATSTYGRLSADNEFVACRSSGINLHVLLLPSVMVSILAGAVSFGFTNYVIPGMVRSLNEFVGSDVAAIVRQRLDRPRGMSLGGGYRIHADECLAHPDDPNRVSLRRVAFVEAEGEEWARFGTAREVRLSFDRGEGRVRVAGMMYGLSYFDRKLGHFLREAEQAIPVNEVRAPVPEQIKFLTWGELFHFLRRPAEWQEVRQKLERLRAATARLMAHEYMMSQWGPDRPLSLGDPGLELIVRAPGAPAVAPGGLGFEFGEVQVEERREGRGRRYVAERASVEILRAERVSDVAVRVELHNARLTEGDTTFERARAALGPVALPAAVVERVREMTDEDLLAGESGAPNWLTERRVEAQAKHDDTVRKIVGVLNERLAFSVSVLFLVVLGAALGIVFRGSHVMVAFGISFVPALCVIVAIVAGRQMACNEGTQLVGLAVIWGGIVAAAVLDGWTLARVVRR